MEDLLREVEAFGFRATRKCRKTRETTLQYRGTQYRAADDHGLGRVTSIDDPGSFLVCGGPEFEKPSLLLEHESFPRKTSPALKLFRIPPHNRNAVGKSTTVLFGSRCSLFSMWKKPKFVGHLEAVCWYSHLEAVRLEITDANRNDLEVGRAERGSDVRGLRELVVDGALRNELRGVPHVEQRSKISRDGLNR